MKKLTLTLALIGLVASLPAQAEFDPSDWLRGELKWSDEYDAYVIAPVLGEDPYQEQLVWSERLGDFIPPLMAWAEAQRAYQEEMVWADEFDAYVQRATLDPCAVRTISSARSLTVALND